MMRVVTAFTPGVYDILRYYSSIVYSCHVITVVVNGERLRSLFTMIITHRKTLYMIVVNGHGNRVAFFIVIDQYMPVYGRV